MNFEQYEREAAEAAAYYALLREHKKLNSVLIGEYRCTHGCLLLHTFQTPNGPAFHKPRYKLSEEMNGASSSESGRKANTEDGDRRWRANSGFVRHEPHFTVNCDHVRMKLIDRDSALAGEPGKPTRQRVMGNNVH